LISHVDLAAMVQGVASTPTLLDVPVPAYGLLLDGRGKVHVFPSADQWVDLHTVDVATNTDEWQSGALYAKTNARLDPGGDSIYMVDTLISTQNLKKFSLSTGVPEHLYDSPYSVDHPTCGKLWFSEDGGTLFTGCGNTFHASATQSLDMIYSGKLPLSDTALTSYPSIVSASHSSAVGEIALLDAGRCGSNAGTECDTVLRLIDSGSYAPTASFWMHPVPLDTDSRLHSQHGMFVFHGPNGDKWVISRLALVAEPGGRFYLARIVSAAPQTH
jgi:chitinase